MACSPASAGRLGRAALWARGCAVGAAPRRGASTYAWDRVPAAVRVTDVSPRDGLQNEALPVSTAAKLELIRRLRGAGVRSIEATSFVNPRLVPQMADADAVLRDCIAAGGGVAYPVLVPNMKGFLAAQAAGAREVTILAAATDTFALKNTRCTVDENLDRALEILRAASSAGVAARAAVSVCLGCPYEGEVPPRQAARVVARLAEAGCREVAICDTIGTASPASMKCLLEECFGAGVPAQGLSVHVHDSYGQAVANVLVALQHGVALVDAAVGGLGGCPFAGPGVSGNLATEDLVYTLHGLGVETGLDLRQLAAAGEWVCQDVLGRPTTSKAGAAISRRAARAEAQAAAPAEGTAAAPAGAAGGAAARLPGPLQGLQVLEVGPGLIAGGWTGATLAYFGADVVKVEAPEGGDGIRKWRHLEAEGGDSLWWQSVGRNKRSVGLDLRREEGRALLARLAGKADVLIENFKPGTLEKWGIGPDVLREGNPRLVVARLSGYGQTGPKSKLPGFASVCEGVGGFRYVNGFPGMPPVRPNLSIGDTLAAMNATIGILLALVRRGWSPASSSPAGQDVDVSIAESVFGLLESCVPEFDRLGVVREPSGSSLTGIVPTGTYPCRDGAHVIIGANGDSLFKRLMLEMGRADLAEDPRFADNAGRVAHQQALDAAIAEWTSGLAAAEAQARCDGAAVPCGPIYSVRDLVQDEHFQARGCFEEVATRDGRPLKVPAIHPKLTATPGATLRGGPRLGEHTDEVLGSLLALPHGEIAALRSRGVIA